MKLDARYKISRDENHVYLIDNGQKQIVVPGTTGILDVVGSKDKVNRLMGWAKKQALLKVAEHIRSYSGKQLVVDETWIEAVRKSAWKRDKEMLKEAGDIGTRVHAAIDAYIDGKEPILDEQTTQGYNNFLHWIKESGINLLCGDTYVGSLEMEYGGALDALGTKDGELVLLDWKTSNALKDENALQVAAYAMAAEETFKGIKIARAFVVRFGKEEAGDFETREVNLESAKSAFKSALELKKAMQSTLWGAK